MTKHKTFLLDKSWKAFSHELRMSCSGFVDCSLTLIGVAVETATFQLSSATSSKPKAM